MRSLLIIAFVTRVGIGVFMGFYTRDLPGNDSWNLFRLSKEETGWLLHGNPSLFYKDLLVTNGYKDNPFSGFFFNTTRNTYFNDLKDNFVIKFNAVLNLLSGCNYYINVLIANFLVVWALIGLIKVFEYWLKPQCQWTVFLTFLFYFPLILWTSSIQKDLLCLILFSAFLFTYSFVKYKKGTKRILYFAVCVLSISLMLVIKNYMAILLLGCTLMTWLARPNTKNFNKRFLILSLFVFGIFILSSFFPDSLNFPFLLARKQNGFYDVGSAQPIPSVPLTGHIVTYFKNLPNALLNSFGFPLEKTLFAERIGWIGFLSFLFFLLLTLIVIIFPTKNGKWKNPFFVMMVAYCLFSYLLIGESVAFYGALLRYRSIAESVFCVLLLQLIDFKKIHGLYIKKKNM